LIEGLKHPSQRVRLVAQRRIFDTATDPGTSDWAQMQKAIVEGTDARGQRGKETRHHEEEHRHAETGRPLTMPEGLQVGLSLQEFSDLVSYVESLKDPAVQAKK